MQCFLLNDILTVRGQTCFPNINQVQTEKLIDLDRVNFRSTNALQKCFLPWQPRLKGHAGVARVLKRCAILYTWSSAHAYWVFLLHWAMCMDNRLTLLTDHICLFTSLIRHIQYVPPVSLAFPPFFIFASFSLFLHCFLLSVSSEKHSSGYQTRTV